MPNVTPGANDRAGSNSRAGFDHHQRLNGNVIAQFRPRVNDCAWMNSRREFYRWRRELGNDLLECFRRIFHPNCCCSDWFGKIGRHNHGGGARFAQLRDVTRIVEKRDLMDGRFCQRSCAGDFRFRIALEFSAGQFRDLFQSKCHSSLLNCRGACAKRLSNVLSGGSTIVRARIFAANFKTGGQNDRPTTSCVRQDQSGSDRGISAVKISRSPSSHSLALRG